MWNRGKLPILPTIPKNQEQTCNNDEEELLVTVVNNEVFTTIGAFLHEDRVINIVEIESRKVLPNH